MDSRFRGLFSRKTTAQDIQEPQQDFLQALPYDLTVAREPPIRGNLPVRGNRKLSFHENRDNRLVLKPGKEHGIEVDDIADSEHAAAPEVPRSRGSERPRTASSHKQSIGINWGLANFRKSSLSADVKKAPKRGQDQVAPPQPSKPAPRVIAIRSYHDPNSSQQSRQSRIFEFKDSHPLHQNAPNRSLRGSQDLPRRSVSRSPTRQPVHVDLADAVSQSHPTYAQDIKKQRYAASGLRVYGEDVADRNMRSESSKRPSSPSQRRKSSLRSPSSNRQVNDFDDDDDEIDDDDTGFEIYYHDQRKKQDGQEDIPERGRMMNLPIQGYKVYDRRGSDTIGHARRARWQNSMPQNKAAPKPQPATYVPRRGSVVIPRSETGMRDVSSRSLSRDSRQILHPNRDDSLPTKTTSVIVDDGPNRSHPVSPFSEVPPRSSSVSAVNARQTSSTPVTDSSGIERSVIKQGHANHQHGHSSSSSKAVKSHIASPKKSVTSTDKSVVRDFAPTSPQSRSRSTTTGSEHADHKGGNQGSQPAKHVGELHIPISRLSDRDFNTDLVPPKSSGASASPLNLYDRSIVLGREAYFNHRLSRPNSSAGPKSTLVEFSPLHPHLPKRLPDDYPCEEPPQHEEVVENNEVEDEEEDDAIYSIPRQPRYTLSNTNNPLSRSSTSTRNSQLTRDGFPKTTESSNSSFPTTSPREVNSHFRLSDYSDNDAGSTDSSSAGVCEEGLLFQDNGYGLHGMLPGIGPAAAGMDKDSVSTDGTLKATGVGPVDSLAYEAPPRMQTGSGLGTLREKELALQRKLASLNIDLRE